MKIVPVDIALDAPPAGLVLTSANGADAAGRAGLPRGMTAWCVGDRTAKAAQDAGFDTISAKGDSSDLVQHILTQMPKGPLLHLHGAHKTGDVADSLTKGGVPCFGRVGYRQTAHDLTDQAKAVLLSGNPLIVPLFSPRTVSLLAKQGPFHAPMTIIAISAAVADAAQKLHPHRVICTVLPDAAAMCHATCDAIDAI